MTATRFTTRFGVEHPIVQAGMSWASSNAALPAAVSNAGALGVIAAGPMRIDDFRAALALLKQSTAKPFAVNIPLNRPDAATILDIAIDAGAPIVIAAQGGPKAHIARAQAANVKWIHVVASAEHARKAVEAGVDAIVAVGGEAGGHPPPDQVSALVLVRAIARMGLDIPLIAAGGVADGAGIAAMLALGADAVQLGTRFMATAEATVSVGYKSRILAAGIADTAFVGAELGPVRVIRNDFAQRMLEAERGGVALEARREIFKAASLKQAALDGDVENGKLEAGQSCGLIDDIPSARDLTLRLVLEYRGALARLANLNIALERGLNGHDQRVL